jgi:hypothetical protein
MGETPEGWIYLCTPGGDFAVFSLKGFSLARWKTPRPPACPPVVFQGKIVFALDDGSLVSYGPSGRPAWNIPAASPVSRLAVNPFTRRLALSRKDRSFEVYAAPAPEESEGQAEVGLAAKAALPFDSAYILPLAAGGFVLVGNDGRVSALSAEGAFQEDFFLKEGRPSGASTDGEGALFFTEARGRLSSYSLAGSPLWTTELTGKPGPPVLSPSSRYLAVGCEDWVVQRFEFVQYGRAFASRPALPAPSPDALKIGAAPSLYRSEYDFIYFMDRASSPDAVKKSESLDICAGRIGKGDFGISLDYICEILRYQAAEPHILRNSKSYPDIQGRALELLGRIGGSENAPFLCALLRQEKDEYLVRAILAARGALRGDPEGLMRREIQNFVSGGGFNRRFVSSVLNALEELSLYSGSLGLYGRAALLRLLENSSSPERRRIQTLLAARP